MSNVLVTGAAGFVGMHTCQNLLAKGHTVTGIDNLNDYYSVQLKRDRVAQLESEPLFAFVEGDFASLEFVRGCFEAGQFEYVVHLGAQAGVRYSLENPHSYVVSNVQGFLNILECCRAMPVKHLVYASSSSVYGANTKMPFTASEPADHPVSLYAATKKSNEAFAHSYSHLFQIPTTGLRFFTVYGPWGRPDMAPMLFANAIVKGEPIKVFNEGKMRRDFTFVEDVAEGVVRTMLLPATPDPDWNSEAPKSATSNAPYRIYNIGNHEPVELLYFIELMEKELGMEAQKIMLPMQPGDVLATYADVEDLGRATGYRPSTSIENGVKEFVRWFKSYYDIR